MSHQRILGSDGTIAQRLPNYEARPEQLQMADAVADALRKPGHLMVEAGKSYLLTATWNGQQLTLK